MFKQYLFCFGLLCLLFPMIGCGNGKCSLKGTVVFSDDQTPLDGGQICLVSEHGIARGGMDQNGHYVVGSVGANDGLPPGKYRIYFMETELFEPVPGGGLPKMVMRIDPKYSNAETSGLSVEVKSSMTHDIQLDRFVSPR